MEPMSVSDECSAHQLIVALSGAHVSVSPSVPESLMTPSPWSQLVLVHGYELEP